MPKKLDIDTVLKRIDEACKKKNCTFLDFCNKEGNICEYQGAKETFLLLQCSICGNVWGTTSYDNFIRKNRKCPKCEGKEYYSIENILKRIKEKCSEQNCIFLGFCDKNGNDIPYIGTRKSFLKLQCNICGNIWKSTNYCNFMFHNSSCPKCCNLKISSKNSMTQEEYIQKAKAIHGDNYNYSETIYKGYHEYIDIICKKHGKFTIRADHHLEGQGCQQCNISHLENNIKVQLNCLNENYEYQKHFTWLGKQSYDFYLPQYDLAIECQGEQHFIPCDFFGGVDRFKMQVKRDVNKFTLSKEHNIKLVYIVNNNVNISLLNKEIYSEENTYHISDFKKELLI